MTGLLSPALTASFLRSWANHGGETGGFHCFVGLARDRAAGVVVLASSCQGARHIDQVGMALLLQSSARPVGAAYRGRKS
jgi:hypothetical protein